MYQTDNPRDSSVFTVSDLNKRAKQLLEITFSSVRVEGEISNLSRPSSGHWYFTLKDAGAQVRCAMFRSRTAGLKFQPKEGDQVELRAKVSLYENRGDYQLIVDNMKPAGEGALLLAFEQLKRKLTAEGLFEQERKRPLPPAQSVKRIAIVTSPTGAAIHDMITVLKRRWPMIEVNVYPTAVQGKDAPQQIINALARANRDAANNPDQAADVVIVGRGGGSLEDLWSFNDEAVARAIIASDLPVISAVGHEVDFTIADFVADVRAPTPSAAAEIISPDGSQLLRHVRDYEQRLVRIQRDKLTHHQRQLSQLTSRLRSPQQLLQTQAQRLDQLEIRLQRAMQLRTHEPSAKLLRLKQALEHMHPQKGLDQHQRQLTQLSERIQRAMNLRLETKKKELISGVRLLNSVSPLEVLSRGYSITQTNDGSVIHNAQDVKSGDTLETRLHSGKVISTVTDVYHD